MKKNGMIHKFFCCAVIMILSACIPAFIAGASENQFGIYQVTTNTLTYGTLVSVEYPIVQGIDGFDQAVLDEINGNYYKEAQKVFDEESIEMENTYNELEGYGSSSAEYVNFSVTCDTVYLDANVVSIAQTYYVYTGGAHPYHYIVASSYDLTTGKKLSMGDLLGCDETIAFNAVVEAYKDTVIGIVENVTEDTIRNVLPDSGAYWITAEGMHVNLAQYVVASYAAGPQHVIVTQEHVQRAMNGSASGNPTEQPQIDAPIEKITVINGIQANAADFIFPYSSSTLLTSEDLTRLEGATVEEEHYKSQLAINEILARYGYIFHAENGGAAKEAYDQFTGKAWYEAAKPYCPSHSANEMLYTYINSTELKNIEIICDWQQAHGCYY